MMTTNKILELIKQLNEELYPDLDSDHRFGEVEYHSNYWCESITIGDCVLWDCIDGNDNIERLVRRGLIEYCRFFSEAKERINLNNK